MECKESSGESDLAPGPLSDSKMPPDLSYPVHQEKEETQNLDLVKSDEVETIIVKQEVKDEDDDSRGASQTFPVGTGKLPTTQMSHVWTYRQADSGTGTCPSYGDPTSGTSYPLRVPSIHSLHEERLFIYEKPSEVEEPDPLADQSPGPPPQSGHSVILNGDQPSLHPLEVDIPKSTTNSTREHLLQELKALGIKRLNFASLNKPGAAKLPENDPSEGVKSYICTEPLHSYMDVSVQEPGISSIQSHSDAAVSESRKLQPIPQERLEGLMPGVVTWHSNPPSSALPVTSVPSPAKKKKKKKSNKVGTKSKACQTALSKQEKEFYIEMFVPSNSIPTLFYDKHQLDPRAKAIVYNVANYFEEKKKKFSLKYNVANVASNVTSLPKKTVHGIISMGRRSLEDDKTLIMPTFGRYHTEKCKNCGDVLVDFALREIIFNGYVEERRALTIKEISANLDDEELYVCQDFLRRRLNELGIDLMRCIATSGYVPLERPELTASRYRYFEDIEKYRLLNKQIVYVFEADLSKVVHGKVTWEPLEGHPTKGDERLMTVIHAARESGFIDGSLFVHSDSLRQHRKSMHPLTVFWLNSLLPKLAKGSVVVLGHKRHHFVRPAEPKPDASWPKQLIVEWLHDHQQGSFSSCMPSAVLLEKVNNIDVGSTFGIDDLVISNGHIPLHLPENHRELNPVELVWRKIIEKFPAINIGSEGPMKTFVRQEFDSISPSELQEAFELAKNHEKRLRHLDMRIDKPVGAFIRCMGGILDRNYALAEDESVDENSSTDEIQDELIRKIAVGSSECCKKKYFKDYKASLVQPRKKRKIDRSQAMIKANDQIPQLMLHISPSSKEDSEISTCDGMDSSEVRDLGENLRISYDTKEEKICPTEDAGCIVGSNEAQPVPQSSSWSGPEGTSAHGDHAPPVPRSSSPSGNASEGTYAHGDCANTQLETLDEKQVAAPPALDVSSSSSTVTADSGAVQILTEPETTEITSVDIADAGPSSIRSPSDWAAECVADVCEITLTNPIKEEAYEGMHWEPTCESLTPWSEELIERVTGLEPPLPNPEGSKDDNLRKTISLGDSDEQKPGLVDETGKEKQNNSFGKYGDEGIPHQEICIYR